MQTGLGRTGRLFACEHSGVQPDLLCLAKGLAGGVPMGAVLCGARIPDAVSLHGSTFGGNPLACAAALAMLEVLEADGLVERSARLGESFRAALRGLAHPAVREVRGLGLMVGVELPGRRRRSCAVCRSGACWPCPPGARWCASCRRW